MLDRKRFAYHFEAGSLNPVVEVLANYQNPDRGFGNGLELDVMAPTSTAVGAECAMMLLDELGVVDSKMVEHLESWILSSQGENGALPPMQPEIADYPHNPWWAASTDETRALSLATFLGKWRRGSAHFFERVYAHFEQLEFPSQQSIFTYPFYLYLRYTPDIPSHEQRFNTIREGIPALIEKELERYPLFVS